MKSSSEPRARIKPPLSDADLEALRQVSRRFGIDRRHFSARGNGADKTEFGIKPFTRACRHVNPFLGEAAPGDVAADRVATTCEAYALSNWREMVGKARAAFFAGRQPRFFSPLDGEELKSLGSFFAGRFDYFILAGPHLRVLLVLGSTAYGLYYPEQNLFLHLTDYEEAREGIVQPIITLITTSWRSLHDWLVTADARRLRRTFVVAENRPSHFLTQTLGFMEREWDQVEAHQQAGGLVAIARNWCFVDPLKVFPALRNGTVLSASSDELTALCLDLRLSGQRIARSNEHGNVDWVARLSGTAGAEPDPDLFEVWISVDAEKARFKNQVPAIARLLRTLGQAAAAGGRRLKVIWDGWTAVDGQWTEKDQRIVDRIDGIVAEIRDAVGAPFAEDPIYGRTFEYKLSRTAGARLALATHGTASITPSIVRKVPTVTYHVPAIMAQTGYAAEATWFPIPEDGIEPDDAPAAVEHQRAFTVDEVALLDTVDRALARSGPQVKSEAVMPGEGGD